MKTYQEYLSIIEKTISEVSLPAGRFPSLYDPIVYTLASGGKRLRPILLLMGCEAVGGAVEEAVMPALGIETFHNFTLLHDDIMDSSALRRGRPTVHVKWNDNTAILSGDTMLTLATDWISRVRTEVLSEVIREFNATAIAVYEGQADDMDFESRTDVTIAEYLEMIAAKTSALLAGALKIGAIIGGASSETCNALWDYGMNLGLAFQIQDDYLDVYGNSHTFGKPLGGDILNDKKTFLLLSAMKSPEVRKLLEEAMSISDPKEKINVVRGIYDREGIPALCTQTVKDYCSKALLSLEKADISEEGRKQFAIFTSKILERQK